mmetsp:Transcript_70652/g.170630  ORF Transcript_70652/g.170630 Transcript_70652/m.170630 type:complete len:257 (-) Transcript_70652:65-835(-)
MHVRRMEHVPPSLDVDDARARRWLLLLTGELVEHLRGGHEVRVAHEGERRGGGGAFLCRRGRRGEHPPHDLGRRDPLRPRDGAVLAQGLRAGVDVLAVDDAGVVAVHDEVDAVLLDDVVQVLVRHHVRHALDHLVHELAAAHHGEPLLVVTQRRPLALGDRDVVVDSDDQVGAERQALPEGVGVAVVEEVEGAVHEDPDLLPPDRQGRARRPLQLSTKRHDLRLRLCELGSHQLRLRLLPAAVCDVVDGQRGREQC